MKFHLLLATLVLAGPSAAARAAEPITGDWLVPGGAAQVRIAPCPAPGKLCGVIVWLKHPNDRHGAPARDLANRDPRQRGRPLLGMMLISDLTPAAPGRWTDGRIYDPHTGKSYASEATAGPDGRLKVESCVERLCQTQTWRRN